MKYYVICAKLVFCILLIGPYMSLPALAEEKSTTTSEATPKANNGTQYASDNNKYDGDLLRLRVNIPGFRKFGDSSSSQYSASKGSKLLVSKDNGDSVTVRFTSLGEGSCDSNCVDENTQYVIDKNILSQYDYGRTGVTFGGLIVPFKFYLGGDKKISASSTLAPYIGYSNSSFYGLTFTPIVSAGLGLVPVSNPTTNDTETKAALSTALGLVVTSSKNEQFNAGVLIGKDFLSKADRNNDPNVSKAWLSFYVGYSM